MIRKNSREELVTAQSVARSLRLFVAILVSCFVVEWAIATTGRLLHLRYPFTTPFLPPFGFLADFRMLAPRARVFPSLDVFTRDDLGLPFQYPVPCLYLYVVLVQFRHAAFAFLTGALAVLFGLTAFFLRWIRRMGAPTLLQAACCVTILCGMPYQYLLDDGNIEYFIWLFVALGLIAFIGRWHYLAAFLFAVAGAFKIYPLLFLLLFIPRRKYGPALLGMVSVTMLYFGSVAGVRAPVSEVLRAQKINGEYMRVTQVIQISESQVRFEHNLVSLYKQPVFWIYRSQHPSVLIPYLAVPGFIHIYSWLAVFTFAGCYLLFIRRLPLLNQFIALTLCALLLPFISYEHTLIHLYTAFACFLVFLFQDVMQGKSVIREVSVRRITLCFAISMSYISALGLWHFGGQIKAIAMLTLFVLCLRIPMPSTLFGDQTTTINPA